MGVTPNIKAARCSLIRFVGLAAAVGMLVGLLEAADLWRYGQPREILKPAVTSIIWFLAPVVDGAASAFVGLLCWVLVSACHWRPISDGAMKVLQGRRALAAITALSVAVLLVAFALQGSLIAQRSIKIGAALFLPALAYRATKSLPLKAAGRALFVVMALLLAGVGIYGLLPPERTAARAGARPLQTSKPNIILITLDTVRADHLSLYGYSRHTTPNIDRWARRSVVFQNAFSASSWTLASHASMFTGLLPHQHGADWLQPMSTNPWTLAEILKVWGYQTAGFSSNVFYGRGPWGIDRGFDSYDDDRFSILHNLDALRVGFRILRPLYQSWAWPDFFERRDALHLNRDVLNWFRRREPRPYFLFINYYDAHNPYRAPRGYAHLFGDASPQLFRRVKDELTPSGIGNLPVVDRTALIAGYDDALASLDHALGDLLDEISRDSSWQNTVVIITSDHGEAFGEHGSYFHGVNLYNETVHVPLLMFGPGIPQGLRISHLVSTQDLFSTALEFAQVSTLPLSATALQKHWRPGVAAPKPGDWVISELTPIDELSGLCTQISLRTQDWEYVRNSRGEVELYRWSQDPAEKVNLAGSTEYGQVLGALHARLCTLVSDSRRPWERPQYLSALDEPLRPFVNVAGPFVESALAARDPGLHIGDAQRGFPPKALASFGQTPDSDLLRSLPYR